MPVYNVNSLNFPGQDQVVEIGTGLQAYLNSALPLTVSLWVKPTGTGIVQTLFGDLDPDNGLRGFEIYMTSADRLGVTFQKPPGAITKITDTPLPIGVWSHVLITYSGNALSSGFNIYVDGAIQAATASGTITVGGSSGSILRFGGRNDRTNFYNGLMDEISVWDGVLSESNILQLFGGLQPTSLSGAANLLDYWTMGDNLIDDATSTTGRITSELNSPVNDGVPLNDVAPFANDYSVFFSSNNGTVKVAADPTLEVNAFTASIWLKTGDTGVAAIWATDDISNGQAFFYIYIISSAVRVAVYDVNGNQKDWALTNSANIRNGVWHHMAVTFGANDLRVYIDGVEETGFTKTVNQTVTNLRNSGRPFNFGNRDTLTWDLNGYLDEASYWGRVLTPAEVAEIYNNMNLNEHSANVDLISWWRFGDTEGGTGVTIADLAGTNNATKTASGATYSIDAPTATGGGGTPGDPLSFVADVAPSFADVGTSVNTTQKTVLPANVSVGATKRAFYKDINSTNPTERPEINDVPSVVQSLSNLLRTRKGERPFNLDFGINLEEKLFDLMEDATRLEILSDVFDAVDKYEPRVKLRRGRSEVELFPDENRIEINLVFNIEGFGDEIFTITENFER